MMVSEKYLRLMRHTIGADHPNGVPYRNYYSASASWGSNIDDLRELVAMGLMVERPSPLSDDTLFHVTAAGYRLLGFSPEDCGRTR